MVNMLRRITKASQQTVPERFLATESDAFALFLDSAKHIPAGAEPISLEGCAQQLHKFKSRTQSELA